MARRKRRVREEQGQTTPSSEVYPQALAFLQRKGLSREQGEAVLAVFTPVGKEDGETEAVFFRRRRASASQSVKTTKKE